MSQQRQYRIRSARQVLVLGVRTRCHRRHDVTQGQRTRQHRCPQQPLARLVNRLARKTSLQHVLRREPVGETQHEQHQDRQVVDPRIRTARTPHHPLVRRNPVRRHVVRIEQGLQPTASLDPQRQQDHRSANDQETLQQVGVNHSQQSAGQAVQHHHAGHHQCHRLERVQARKMKRNRNLKSTSHDRRTCHHRHARKERVENDPQQ